MGKEHLGLLDGKHPIISRISTLETPKKSWDAYHLSFNHPFGGADPTAQPTDGSPAQPIRAAPGPCARHRRSWGY
jgi:hypothetical protein